MQILITINSQSEAEKFLECVAKDGNIFFADNVTDYSDIHIYDAVEMSESVVSNGNSSGDSKTSRALSNFKPGSY